VEKVRDGFFQRQRFVSIARLRTVTFWSGPEFGLHFRFDGVRNRPGSRSRTPERLLGGAAIRTLLGGSDGRLWIGINDQGPRKAGGWTPRTLSSCGQSVSTAGRGFFDDAKVWAGVYAIANGSRCEIRSGPCACSATMAASQHRRIVMGQRRQSWAGARTGCGRWKPGPPKLYTTHEALAASIRALIEGRDNGGLLIRDEERRRATTDSSMWDKRGDIRNPAQATSYASIPHVCSAISATAACGLEPRNRACAHAREKDG